MIYSSFTSKFNFFPQGFQLENQYENVEILGQGGMGVAYKVKDIKTQKEYVLKGLLPQFLKNERQIDAFLKEIQTLSLLNHRNIVKLCKVINYQDQFFILYDYIPGKNLKVFSRQRSLSLNQIISIIIQISEALDFIHSKNIFHKDIKCSNIIIQEQKQTLKAVLIDFGLADFFSSSYLMVGTPEYLPPEQTGRFPISVDGRSDLYSLGIVFYRLLCGELPFKGANTQEVLDKQLSQKPASISDKRPSVPKSVVSILEHLLEKQKEKRYQSASGLIYDLKLYLNFKFERLAVPFQLRRSDVCYEYENMNALIGREMELLLLKEFFSDVKQNGSGHVFITGISGSGKTKLVLEFIKTIKFSSKTLWVTNVANSNIPFYPVSVIVNRMLLMIRKKIGNDSLNCFLQSQFSSQLYLISQFIRPVKNFLSLEHGFEKNIVSDKYAFYEVFLDFWKWMTQQICPLIIVFDDVQWMDVESIRLIQYVFSRQKKQEILFIYSIRSEELGGKPLWIQFQKTICKNNSLHRELEVLPLNPKNSKALINAFFNNQQEEKSFGRFYDQIELLTRGVPYFILELLKTCISQNIIFQEKGSWKFDEKVWREHHQLNSSFYTNEDIGNIVLSRLASLEQQVLTFLQYSALCGKTFAYSFMDEILGGSREILVKGLELQVIIPITEKDDFYQFSHDKIREYFLSLIPNQLLEAMHRNIAECYEKRYVKEKKKDFLFPMTHHYMKTKKNEKILFYAIKSGNQARKAFANTQADIFLRTAFKILERKNCNNWRKRAIIHRWAEVRSLSEKRDESLTLYDTLIFGTYGLLSPIQVSRLNLKKGEIHFRAGRIKEAGDLLLQELYVSGKRIPENISKRTFIAAILKICTSWIQGTFFSNKQLEEKDELCLELLMRLPHVYGYIDWKISYLTALLLLAELFKFRKIKSYRVWGCSILFAFLSGILPKKIAKLLRSELDDALRQMDVSMIKGESYGFYGCGELYQGQFDKAEILMRKSIDIFKKIGNFEEVMHILNQLIWVHYHKGNYSQCIELNDILNQYALDFSGKIHLLISWEWNAVIWNIWNPALEPKNYQERLEITETTGSHIMVSLLYNHWMNMLFRDRKYISAIDKGEKALKLIEDYHLYNEYTANTYGNLACCYLDALQNLIMSEELKKRFRNRTQKILKQFRRISFFYKNHQPQYYRMLGTLEFLKNNFKKSQESFYLGLKASRRIGAVPETGRIFMNLGVITWGKNKKRARKFYCRGLKILKKTGCYADMQRWKTVKEQFRL